MSLGEQLSLLDQDQLHFAIAYCVTNRYICASITMPGPLLTKLRDLDGAFGGPWLCINRSRADSSPRYRSLMTFRLPTRNTVAKERAGQKEADSDYLFASRLERLTFRQPSPIRLNYSRHGFHSP
jgi:hypothetical protein